MDSKDKKASAADSLTVGIIYICYLYFLTHPEKMEEIKWWLQEKWDRLCNHTRHSLDFYESIFTFSRRVEEIRSLPETGKNDPPITP